jgi:hypothetical protein
MFLRGVAFSGFRQEGLRHERRKALNRARQSGLRFERLGSLECHWPDLREIYVSTAERTTYGYRPEYYVQQEDAFRRDLRREFSLEGRDWFGVFSGERLIAFLYTCLVDRTAHLLVTKFNHRFLEMRPSDFLHFEVIRHYQDLEECEEIYAGRSIATAATIDRFKAGYGFERVEMAAYQWTNPAVRSAVVVARAVLRRTVGRRAGDRRGWSARFDEMAASLGIAQSGPGEADE